MTRRQVTGSSKDKNGVITGICGSWGSATKAGAIAQIEAKTHEYYVKSGNQEIEVLVIKGDDGKYLRTSPDDKAKNNLTELPDCP